MTNDISLGWRDEGRTSLHFLSLSLSLSGSQLFHSVACVLVQFLMLRLMGRTVTGMVSSFLFQMMYLLLGYYYTATDQYDIKWTMPHCVLTLKLVGKSFEIPLDIINTDKVLLCLRARRNGMPIKINGSKWLYSLSPSLSSIFPAIKRFSLGLVCLSIYTIGSPSFPDSYLLSEQFEAQPFWYRCLYIIIWGKITLYKYVSCWVIAEGVCILSGLGYNGRDAAGVALWDACANMKVWQYETTPLFTGTIAAFNTNTNAWVARHVFKRLKFLGNKMASQAATLFFLAIWHGLHSGYLVCFSLELIIVVAERQVGDPRWAARLSSCNTPPRVSSFPSVAALIVSLHLGSWCGEISPLVASLCSRRVSLLKSEVRSSCCSSTERALDFPLLVPLFLSFIPPCSWLGFVSFPCFSVAQVYTSIYFCGHVLFLSSLLVMPYLRRALVPRKKGSEKKEQ
nr:PREDICTED: lysophospholipid acyltransferase 5 [Lepisosteus oculatus]